MLNLFPEEIRKLFIDYLGIVDIYRSRLVCKQLEESICKFSLKFQFIEKLRSSKRRDALKGGILKCNRKYSLHDYVLSKKDLDYLIKHGRDIRSFKPLARLFLSDSFDINACNLGYLIGRYGHTIDLPSSSKKFKESLQEGLCYYRGNFDPKCSNVVKCIGEVIAKGIYESEWLSYIISNVNNMTILICRALRNGHLHIAKVILNQTKTKHLSDVQNKVFNCLDDVVLSITDTWRDIYYDQYVYEIILFIIDNFTLIDSNAAVARLINNDLILSIDNLVKIGKLKWSSIIKHHINPFELINLILQKCENRYWQSFRSMIVDKNDFNILSFEYLDTLLMYVISNDLDTHEAIISSCLSSSNPNISILSWVSKFIPYYKSKQVITKSLQKSSVNSYYPILQFYLKRSLKKYKHLYNKRKKQQKISKDILSFIHISSKNSCNYKSEYREDGVCLSFEEILKITLDFPQVYTYTCYYIGNIITKYQDIMITPEKEQKYTSSNLKDNSHREVIQQFIEENMEESIINYESKIFDIFKRILSEESDDKLKALSSYKYILFLNERNSEFEPLNDEYKSCCLEFFIDLIKSMPLDLLNLLYTNYNITWWRIVLIITQNLISDELPKWIITMTIRIMEC